ncbi:ABC transporter substrate-binding protein [Roseovarius sp. CAU 1744]|uniref:ABC transporter substrate-binding protein n=1 Tax=Roseovarius sp. CAU 1744 TaxID=3140368 RepID=UPI00325AA3E1
MSIYKFGADLALSARLPRFGLTTREPVRVGLLASPTGDAAKPGIPGLNGCKLWAERVNTKGGLQIGDRRRLVEVIAFDDQLDPGRAVLGVKHLVLEQEVKFILMRGGDTVSGIVDFLNRHKVLASTNSPSDLGPDRPYLIAPCQCHPLYVAIGVDWLRENRPQLKTVSICAQQDSVGLQSLATYRAAFKLSGIQIVKEVHYAADTHDVEGIVDAMLGPQPDIMCWNTSSEPLIHALSEAAYRKGFNGQILSYAADNYQSLIARTSAEFMEGTVFHFPEFDDPALGAGFINFPQPAEFYAEYNRRFPGEWSPDSWVYCSVLEMWRRAVERIQTSDPVAVLSAMKFGGFSANVFGDARWWGREIFGMDHVLIGSWPVVEIRNKKAKIVEFRSVLDWCNIHGDALVQEMRDLGQTWHQRSEDSSA